MICESMDFSDHAVDRMSRRRIAPDLRRLWWRSGGRFIHAGLRSTLSVDTKWSVRKGQALTSDPWRGSV